MSAPSKPRRRWARRLAIAGAIGFAALNLVAARHARSMTHFGPGRPGDDLPPSPEDLSPTEKLVVLATGLEIPRPENAADPSAHSLDFETLVFPADDGSRVHAWFVPSEPSYGVVVLLHGYVGRAECVLP